MSVGVGGVGFGGESGGLGSCFVLFHCFCLV